MTTEVGEIIQGLIATIEIHKTDIFLCGDYGDGEKYI